MFPLLAALSLAAPVPAQTPDWVTVKGAVVWPEKEKIPEAKAIDLSNVRGGDADYIRKGPVAFDETFVIDEKTRGLKDVIVWLRPDDDDPKAKFPADRIHPDLAKAKPATHTVTNDFCRFDRRVVAMRAGDTLEVVNKSKVAVAVRIDIGDTNAMPLLAVGKDPYKLEKVTPGVGTFRDMIHQGWVNGVRWTPGEGFVRVFEHPYFAVTNELGEFELKQVPKGKWRVMYWHESGYHKGKDGRLGFKVEVEGNRDGAMAMKPVEFEVPKR